MLMINLKEEFEQFKKDLQEKFIEEVQRIEDQYEKKLQDFADQANEHKFTKTEIFVGSIALIIVAGVVLKGLGAF